MQCLQCAQRPVYTEPNGVQHKFCGRTCARNYMRMRATPYYRATPGERKEDNPRKAAFAGQKKKPSELPIGIIATMWSWVPDIAVYLYDLPPSPPPSIPSTVFFYHRKDPHYCFTNFSPHKVEYEGKIYPTSEHLFQAFKFFKTRPDLAEHVRTVSSQPSQALSAARQFASEIRPDWLRFNITAMDSVLAQKFQQHPDIRRELLATGKAQLIEDSAVDSFWGCGADKKGRNELGKALMRLRTVLRQAEKARGKL